MNETKHVFVRVRRQDGPGQPPRWEQFAVARRRRMTVADALEAIAKAPRTDTGDEVAPVAWASSCTYPACGVCTMTINGQARPACSTRIEDALPKGNLLVLTPLGAFPVRRDLWVDRSRLRSDAARVLGTDAGSSGSAEPGVRGVPAGPGVRGVPAGPGRERLLERFSRCTRCGACVEACPEAGERRAFVGPYALGVAHAAQAAGARLDVTALTARGGIQECGNAQNCLEICPEQIPLDEAIGQLARLATRGWFKSLLGR